MVFPDLAIQKQLPKLHPSNKFPLFKFEHCLEP